MIRFKKTFRLFLLINSALLCSFLKLNAQTKNSTPISFLALGDSYTIGESVSFDKKWPNQLMDSLISNNYKIDEVKIIAKTGWTTTNLLSAIEQENVSNYNLVSLLIGVNNQFQSLDFEEFKQEFDELLNISIKIAQTKKGVFVVSIPDYGVTPFGKSKSNKIKKELDAYNAYMKSKCESLEIPFIDITEISRKLDSNSNALAYDSLHPSEIQYREWVKEIYPIVEKILNK